MSKIDILSLGFKELETALREMGEKPFRAGQIYKWLHCGDRVKSFEEMTDISKELRGRLEDSFEIVYPKAVRKLVSKKDGTRKILFELSDNNHVETVIMDYRHGKSICVSTQVGCKMGCTFCASTIAGFKRNLSPSEILTQIYSAENECGVHIDSVVLMGIGEPLDNYDNVVKFLDILSHPKGRNMSLRHVSLSTCGIVPRIKELAELRSGLTLSVSLHNTTNEGRSAIMPVNRRYDINELLDACREYTKATGRRISFEYAVIDGVNDSREDAKRLAKLLDGMICHVNIIPVNPVKERDYHSKKGSAAAFAKQLESLGINATVRRTLGSDIDAACGQLRREYEI